MAETVPDSARKRAFCSAEGAEILHHRHAALEERQVVRLGDRLARRAQLGRDPRQPDVQQEAGRVFDQLIVLVGPHEGVLLGRLAVLKTRVGRDVDAGNAVIAQAHRVGHRRSRRRPCSTPRRPSRNRRRTCGRRRRPGGNRGPIPGRCSRHRRPVNSATKGRMGTMSGLPFAHRRHVTVQPALIASFHGRCSGKTPLAFQRIL